MRIKAIFTNRMDQKTIDMRVQSLEEYLNAISEHLITRSTPYFEQIFQLPPEVIVEWINYYKSFEGVRNGENVEIKLDQATIEENPELKSVALQTNKEDSFDKVKSSPTRRKVTRVQISDNNKSVNNKTEIPKEERKRNRSNNTTKEERKRSTSNNTAKTHKTNKTSKTVQSKKKFPVDSKNSIRK